jgi:hypothetical protein
MLFLDFFVSTASDIQHEHILLNQRLSLPALPVNIYFPFQDCGNLPASANSY